MFDGGSVSVDTNGSIGTSQKAEVRLKSLHVQDKGTFELRSYDINNEFKTEITNITVSLG